LRDGCRGVAVRHARTTLVEASPHDRVWGIGLAADDPRAEYGGQILPTLSAKLVPEYGQGYSERNLAV
jgi:hypothetical protein